MRRHVVYLVGTIVLVVGSFLATIFLTDNRPQLGLDLQGGISVVLRPEGDATPETLDVAVAIIRNRVDAFGVIEPEINRQGDSIVVDLPGVEDRDQALDLVGQTGELRFRPVLAALAPADPSTTTTTAPADPNATTTVPADPNATTTVPADPGATTTTTAAASDATTPTSAPAGAQGLGARTLTTAPIAATRPAQATDPGATTTPPTAPADPSATTVPADPNAPTTVPADPNATTTTTAPPTDGSEIPTTPPDQDLADQTVVLPDRDGAVRYQLGPAELTGADVSGARAVFQQGGQGWVVLLDLKSEGLAKFNALAQRSFGQPPPQNAVAIVLDAVVYSAPAFQTSSFDGEVQISGDFSESEAKNLANVLRYGALPVRFDERDRVVQSVSPTLGSDQLRAGILAGVIGLAIVALYMLVYYRLLGLVVIAGLALTAMIFFTLTSWLSASLGLTLTLAGVTGMIVSVGVTVDSYVVYFERLKDEVRTGKTVRSSLDRGFTKAFRTIVAADLVSLIGAVVLYLLSVGSVRGFAFFLGISVIIDLFIAYFFMHPLVSILARKPALVRMKGVGIATGLDVRGAVA